MAILKREPELADILGTFSKTVDNLRTYAARKRERVSALKGEIASREAEVADSEANIAQADASAEKIAAILGAAA